MCPAIERETMKKTIAMLMLAPIAVLAKTVEMPKTPSPRFADCEESISKPMSLWREGTRTVTVTIECDCTQRNALRVALGKDANKDGKVQRSEARIQFGWDTQGWVLDLFDQWLQFKEAVKVDKERKTLKVVFEFDAAGSLSGFSAWDGKKRVFENVSKSIPKGMYAKDNDIVEVKRNGVDNPDERVTISLEPGK